MVGVAARVWQHASMAESTPQRTGQAAGRRGGAGHRPAVGAGALGAGHRAGLRAAVERGAGPDPGQLHLPGRRATHPGAVGADRVQGPVVRDRPGHRPRRHPDVQALPDGRPAPQGVPGRCVRGARPISTCAPWPASLAPREPTETALLAIRSGRAPALARRGEPATSRCAAAERLRGVRRALRRPLGDRRGDRPARGRRRGAGPAPSCGTASSAAAAVAADRPAA